MRCSDAPFRHTTPQAVHAQAPYCHPAPASRILGGTPAITPAQPMSELDAEQWQRISAELDEMLELPEAQQAARLAALRSSDPRLADAITALLQAGAKAREQHFLTGTALPGTNALEAAGGLSAGTLAGQRLGAWMLVELLGQGGSGSVWRAQRVDGRFEGEAAIKLLHPSLLDAGGGERFRREGAILGRLSHPHIAHLMDAGVSPMGQPYLVLELVSGERIDAHCDARQLGIEARLALFSQVFDAVGFAHRQLVVHRDIKPSNVLVTHDGQVQLLDFGIAKLLGDDGTSNGDSALTRDAGRWLTPEYAAPEQLRGEPVTTATDVYSIGMLLFELLAGMVPQPTPSGSGDRETLTSALGRVRREDPAGAARMAAARATTPDNLRRALGGDLQNVLARALAPLPADRYASVDALAEDVRRHLAHEPVSARAPSFGYRLGRFVRRHRGGVAAAAALLLAILGGVIGTITQAQRAEANATAALRERDRAVNELVQANAARELIGFLLTEGGGGRLTPMDLLARAETMVEKQFGRDQALRARLNATIAEEYKLLEETDRAMKVLDRALAAAERAGDLGMLGELRCSNAAVLVQVGEFDAARRQIDGALALLDRAQGDVAGARAYCLSERARAWLETGEPRRALTDAQKAAALLQAPRADQQIQATSQRLILADIKARLGDYPGAIATYERALQQLADIGRERSGMAANSRNNLAVVLLNAGQLARAATELEASMAITREIVGDTGLNPATETNYAGAIIELGRAPEAAQRLERALAFAERNHAERFVGFIATRAGTAWCRAGDAARCAQRLAYGRRSLEKILPPGHSAFGTVAVTAALLAQLQHDDDRARVELQRAVQIYDAAEERNPMSIVARGMRARLEHRAGNLPLAEALASRAVSDARAYTRGLASSEWLGTALLNAAAVRDPVRDPAGARALAAEAASQLQGSLGANAPGTLEAEQLVARLAGTRAR